jgi:Acyl-CoA dehydrogenase, C-terminal domain
MQLHLNETEYDIERAVAALFARQAGPDAARLLADSLDRPLLEELERNGFLDMADDVGPNLVAGVLLVEQAEKHFVRAPVASRVLVAPELLSESALAVGLVDEDRESVTRYAGLCDVYLFLRGSQASMARASDVKITTVPTRWGYPTGRVMASRSEPLTDEQALCLRDRWHLALAAEVSGAMCQAVDLSRDYVTQRRQFGRAIGSFQAVQHRLAEAFVVAEGARWLTRLAAGKRDTRSALIAAAFALDGITSVIDGVHQVTGAIGITTEYDLALLTGRLIVLREELGGPRHLAAEVARERWVKT